jgi:hypothetical protein
VKKTAVVILGLALLMLGALAVPVMASQPKVWTEKNNDKFETFQVFGRGSFSASLDPNNWQYIPSKEQCNKVIVSWDEVFSAMEITVDGNTYVMGTHFTYEGRATYIFYDPVFPSPPPVIPFIIASRHFTSQVDYEYTFLPASGIEGTIRMQAIFKVGEPSSFLGGDYSISSLSGTGDLRNVQIKATSNNRDLPPHTPSWNIGHTGIVIGWPE